MGNEVKIKIKGENRFGKTINKAVAGLGKLKGVGQAVGRGIAGAFKAGAVALAALIGVSGVAIRAFGKQQAAEKEVEAALRNRGDAVDEILPKLKKFASEIQKQTKLGDEEILSQIALARNLGISADKLEGATKAAVGLSAKLKIDLKSAMLLVGKAAAGNTSSLSRYGITLDETLSPQEKFNTLLKLGAQSFGLAVEEADTFEGRLQQTKNAFGDMLEVLGESIVGGGEAESMFKKLTAAIETLTESGKIQLWVQNVKDAFESLAPVVGKVGNLFLGVKKKIQQAAAFAGGFVGAQGSLRERLEAGTEASRTVPEQLAADQARRLEKIKARIKQKIESADRLATQTVTQSTASARATAPAAGKIKNVSLSDIFTARFGDIAPGKAQLGTEGNPMITIVKNQPQIG